MRRCVKKGLAFLLAFALLFGNGVPVAAAELTEDPGILPEDAEAEETEIPEKSETETEEILEEDGEEKQEAAESDREGEEESQEQPEDVEKIEGGPDGEGDESAEEVLAIEESMQTLDTASKGVDASVVTLGEETEVEITGTNGLEIFCTPEKTGYYRLSDDLEQKKYYAEYNMVSDGGMYSIGKVPMYNANIKDVQYLYWLETGQTYRIKINAPAAKGAIQRIEEKDLPQYQEMEADKAYTVESGKVGYFKLPDSDKKYGFFFGCTDENIFVDSNASLEGERLDIRFEGLAWRWITQDWNGSNGKYSKYLIVLPGESERTAVYKLELKEVFEEISDWKDPITLKAGEAKYFEYIPAEIGDYLFPWQDNLNFTILREGSLNYQASRNLGGQRYMGFYVSQKPKDEEKIRFQLKNAGESEITVEPVTDEVFGGTQVALGESIPYVDYLNFTALEDGIYFLKEKDPDGWSISMDWAYKKKQYGDVSAALHGHNAWSGLGLPMQQGETVKVAVSNGKSDYVDSSFMQVEAKEVDGTQFTIPASSEASYYIFTPERSGCYQYPESTSSQFLLEYFDEETGRWNSTWGWNFSGEMTMRTRNLEAGKKYCFYAAPYGEDVTVRFNDPVKKTFTAISKWSAVIALSGEQTKYFSFSTAAAGDYLIELSDNIELFSYETTDGVSYRKVQVNGKTYACATFDGSKKGTWKFELKNKKNMAVKLVPVTQWDLMKPASIGPNRISQAGNLPVYDYYSFTPEETGIYSISGEPRWVCKKDGTALSPEDLTLAAGETCYMSFAGGEEKEFSIVSSAEYEALTKLNSDNTFTLESGQKYLLLPDKNGTCTAFASRLEPEQLKLQCNDGTGWRDWSYDAQTGNYSMPMTAGKFYTLCAETTDGSAVKIGRPGYMYKPVSGSFKITSLKDTDDALKGQGSASRMSAAYKISGTQITASGTLKYIRNCLNYVGTEQQYKAGYFLAFRIQVDKGKFKQDGYISLSYLKDGTKQIKFYEYSETDTLKNQGYVDVILDMNEDLQEVGIRVGLDSLMSVKTYRLNLTGIGKETFQETGGTVSEMAVYGVNTSSPVIAVDKDGTKVIYHSVAWSEDVQIPQGETASVSGNYAALKVAVPESMRNTDVRCAAVDSQGAEIPGLVTELSGDRTYALLIFDAGRNSGIFGRSMEITWSLAGNAGADAQPGSVKQKIAIDKGSGCYFETIPKGTELPKAIAINGLTSTMYVGQTQNIVTTITKKYEEDKVCLSYSSSDNTVLCVNRVTGEMEALKAGTAVITVEAVDGVSNPLVKTAKITVKNPTAPASVKISEVKDTSVKVSWAKNTTGQKVCVYAVPYTDAMGKKAANWKAFIEGILENAANEEETQVLPDGWISSDTPSIVNRTVVSSMTVEGLKADTSYVFYVRNQSKTSAGSLAAAGNVSAKTTTKQDIFSEIKVFVLDGTGQEMVPDSSGNRITVRGDSVPGTDEFPVQMDYKLYCVSADEDGDSAKTEMDKAKTVCTSVSYKSSNTKVVKADKKGGISLGGEAGTAELYITGKDASGAARESNRITIEVIKTPAKLKAKTTTLVIGQSITLKELINYEGVKGSLAQMDMKNVDFASMWSELERTGSFWKEETSEISGDTVITAADFLENAKGMRTSGNTVKVNVSLKDGADTKAATIKINAMSSPAIKNVTAEDTSVLVTFTPNSTVRELAEEDYYYTVTVTDMVTNRIVIDEGDSSNMEVTFEEAENSTQSKPSYTCEVTGLSANKKYRISVKAHYDAEAGGEEFRNEKASGTKDITTKKRLLASEGNIDISYVSLPELKLHPDADTAERIWKDDLEKHIYLKNNETYVFIAEVSELARILETDKLKWSISSGDTKSASIKPTSSTFEAQLSTVRTGTFTVTATSTATKQTVVTFTVTVDPFQSGERADALQADAVSVAWLGSDQIPLLQEKKRKAA